MSDEFGFAPPAFQPDEALLKLKRELRALGLNERDGRFERAGSAVARASVDGAVINAALVKRPSRSSPEWQAKTLKHSADCRDFVAELKKRLGSWSSDD